MEDQDGRLIASSPEMGDIAGRLAAVYGMSRRLAADGRNDFHGYSFVTLSAVVDTLRSCMSKAGLAVLPSVVDVKETEWASKRGTGMKVTITVDFLWIAAESGQWIVTRWVGVGLDNGDKAYNKAYSAVLKQALLKTFLVSTGPADDVDYEEPEPADLGSEIRELLGRAKLPPQQQQQFREFLAESFGVELWKELTPKHLVVIRDRLKSLSNGERHNIVIEKLGAIKSAA